MALWPLLQQAVAYSRAAVGVGGTTYYTITTAGAANELVTCSVPSQIEIRGDSPRTSTFVRCRNNTNKSIILTWSNIDQTGWITASGSVLLSADGVSRCVSMTLTPGTNDSTRTVTFRGVTDSSSDLYVELYFTGSVQLRTGNSSNGGCP